MRRATRVAALQGVPASAGSASAVGEIRRFGRDRTSDAVIRLSSSKRLIRSTPGEAAGNEAGR